MMKLASPPNWLGLTVAGPWIVILDLRRNRYLALERRSRDADGPIRALDDELAAQLWLRGLSRGKPAEDRALHSVLMEFARRISPPLCAWIACAWSAQVLATGKLEGAIQLLRAAKRTDGDDAREGDWRAYLKVRPWYPSAQLCLFDSLALAFFLSARGKRAELVFGVATNPFAAHAWVESSGRIVNDEADACAPFSEILRV